MSHPVELVDLNYGGCGITSPVELRPGEIVDLSVQSRGSLKAKVRWYCDGRAGLDFAPSEPERTHAPRRVDRINLSAEVGLRVAGRHTYRVQVYDVSTDGCQVELVERPAIGDRVFVKFDELEALESDVCWVVGHRAGLMFVNRIHAAVFDLLADRHGA